MPFRPIQWARQTTDGRQPDSDGASLLNLYATNPVPPQESKAPVVLYQSPGYESVGQVGAADTDSIVAMETATDGAVRKLMALTSGPASLILSKAIPDPFSELMSSAAVTVSSPSTTVVRLRTYRNVAMALYGGELHAFSVDTLAPLTVGFPDGQSGNFVDLVEAEGYFVVVTHDGYLYHMQHASTQFGRFDFGRARTHADFIVGMAAYNRRLYVFGDESVEQWGYTGSSEFAFQRDPGFVGEIGCASAATIRVFDQGLCFLGSDGLVYLGVGQGGFKRVSYEAVEYDIAQADAGRSRAFTYTEEGHRFYSLTLFPRDGTDPINWTLDITTSFWHSRDEGATSILTVARFANANYTGIAGNRNLFHYSLDYGKEDGVMVTRQAVSPILHANQQRIQVPSFQVDIPKLPLGGATGTENDCAELEWSDDGKKTWKPANTQDTQKLLDEHERYRWNFPSQFRSGRNYRLTFKACRRIQVLGAYIERKVSPN